jgi:F-type H+-transporting ATPase subunit b
MLIDWFTVGAQALNFVILVWLLKRFLYKPILAAIDAREKHIADALTDADTRRQQATQEKQEFQHKRAELEQQRGDLLARATEAADTEGKRLLDAARRTADTLGMKRREALDTEARNLNQALRRRTQQEVFAIARRTLGDLAGAGLEQRMVAAFATRLRALGDTARADLGAAALATTEPALLRSATDLSGQEQASLHNMLREALSQDIALRFETTPDLVGGIELTINGRKLAWSISAYLDDLEQAVNDTLMETPA